MKKLIAKIQADPAFLDMARNGARIQLDNILDVFPELRTEVEEAAVKPSGKTQPKKPSVWTPAKRKAHSAMMKARWAELRKRRGGK